VSAVQDRIDPRGIRWPESTGWAGVEDLTWEDLLSTEPERSPAEIAGRAKHDLAQGMPCRLDRDAGPARRGPEMLPDVDIASLRERLGLE
jgi:hypothetical protein